ncbi:hypothetical protein DU428_02785 [Oceanihabitans sediminis]|uniref:O-antigen ligase-related domain-containing protein n=1 Tax=Oceanihabitans sediminis TaxID=1812012 RepID=A0A368P602_9FLAO|nr:hypothetical protein DU428_02785 [Oceanihabitans sediminis]
MITSIVSSLYYGFDTFNFLKGILYFTKPILMILVGYAFCLKINNKDFIFKFLIYFSILLALSHIFIVIKWFYLEDISVNYLRYLGGKSNLIEFFGLIFLLSRNKLKLFFLNKNFVSIGVIILTISFVFYFSRTQFVALIIFMFCIYGYTRLNTKSILIGVSSIFSIILLFVILHSVNLDRNSTGVEGFLYKLKVAPSEIFNADINIENHAELWDKWRGFEAKKAIDQISERGTFAVIFGAGIGSLVDLDIDFAIQGIDSKLIPIIHNGYILVYFKAGLLGVFFYLVFIARLYSKTYAKSINNGYLETINNLVGGFAFYLLFTSLIISGIYNVNSLLPFILGYFLCVNHLTNLNRI